jgi:predicted MFS family arabinose efflux permease
VAFFSHWIDRRLGILISLALHAIPTALLAVAPDLTTFTILRITQGLFMASAFSLTLAYLGEQCSAMDAGGAFAAYITGNVASNLIGRLISAGVADYFGLAWNFYFFAALNLAGAVLVYFTIAKAAPTEDVGTAASSPVAALSAHFRNGPLRAAFGIGFCILFAFIGTFTYVNFVLVREPLSLGRMELGFVYFVFLPSIVTTLLAGTLVRRFGTQLTLWSALAVAALGLPLLLLPWSPWERSLHRPRRPVLSAVPRPATGLRRAASIWRAISLAVSSAALCSASCSTASAGAPASPGSRSRLQWPASWRSA